MSKKEVLAEDFLYAVAYNKKFQAELRKAVGGIDLKAVAKDFNLKRHEEEYDAVDMMPPDPKKLGKYFVDLIEDVMNH